MSNMAKQKSQYRIGRNPNSLKNLKPVKKGEPSRNPHGRPRKEQCITEAVRRLLAEGMEKDKALVEAIAENWVKRALKHYVDLNMLLDRTEGKVPQPIQNELTTKDFNINITVSSEQVKDMVSKVLAGERTTNADADNDSFRADN